MAVGLCGIDLGAYFAPAAFENGLRAVLRRRSSRAALALFLATVLPLGSVELLCRFLTWAHVLEYHQAIQTVWRSGADDWRLATITGDENREPDPVLLWRPVARKPFTFQRFKGPIAQVPKPPDVLRVMCYGDSLTDGPPKGGWPTWLGVLWKRCPPIPGRRVEVLNAGVAGYSSHQGLLRFLQEVDQYQPDLLLVSFGWNDAAEAAGQPDRSFRIPAWPLVACQRALIPYRAYLVFMNYTQRWRATPPKSASEATNPRVSVRRISGKSRTVSQRGPGARHPDRILDAAPQAAAGRAAITPDLAASVPDYNAALLDWSQSRERRIDRRPATILKSSPQSSSPMNATSLRRVISSWRNSSATGWPQPRTVLAICPTTPLPPLLPPITAHLPRNSRFWWPPLPGGVYERFSQVCESY